MAPILVISNGIIRNLLKQDFYLRIPTDRDRPGRSVICPPFQDIILDAQDFFLIENQLIHFDRMNIIRIIKYPEYNQSLIGKILIYQDTPPSDTNAVWISSITGDHYIYDPVLNMWRSLNPEIIPFIRNFSQGTPLYPFGAPGSFPIYVNSTVDRNYLVYRLFVYATDTNPFPHNHKIYLKSTGSIDEELSIANGVSVEILPTSRILHPTDSLEIRHGTDFMVKYISVTVELSQLIPPI